MTKYQLKQYRSLKKAIEQINRTIATSVSQATVKSSRDFPYCNHNVTVSGLPPSEYNRMCELKDRKMSPRTGRPTESKKDIKLQIRVDKQTIDDLDKCAENENSTRSDIIRKGIQLVKAEQLKK